MTMKEAMFTQENKCKLCPHECVISLGNRGICGVRINKDGIIKTLVYSKPVSIAIDPIEKKPLYHFYPDKKIFSFGTVGCNFKCLGCQNWEIAAKKPLDEEYDFIYTPEKIVQMAKEEGCDMIAYTYTEPTIFYEYMYDTAKIAKREGIKNVIVSNGYINKEPLKKLCKYIDAANIDIKFFNDKKYLKYTGARLQPVLDSLKILKQEKVWCEIANLVVPGWSDDLEEFEKMCQWIHNNLGKNVPLHISRFFGHYKLSNLSPTPIDTLHDAAKIAKKYLNFVYLGNIKEESNTYCPKCNNLLIKRNDYLIENNISKGQCAKCSQKIEGIWSTN